MAIIIKIFFSMILILSIGCDSGVVGVTPCVAAKAEWTGDSDLKRKVREKQSKMSSSEKYDFNLATVNCIDQHNHSWMK